MTLQGKLEATAAMIDRLTSERDAALAKLAAAEAENARLRALCIDLTDAVEDLDPSCYETADLGPRARAALAAGEGL